MFVVGFFFLHTFFLIHKKYFVCKKIILYQCIFCTILFIVFVYDDKIILHYTKCITFNFFVPEVTESSSTNVSSKTESGNSYVKTEGTPYKIYIYIVQ